ncbi:hypothetical protein ACFVV7_26825 [Streptomyces globisporus]|uniref:hypothetical protein n=1 Tax=Streptomyces globisporus TaxID=1908 RepID=UPI0036D7D915
MDIRTEVDNFLGEKRALVDAMVRAFRGGTPAKEVARSVAAAFSRDQVTQYLSAISLHDAARKALLEADLTFAADVFVTGIDAPREARLIIAADPQETAGFASLPTRVREAFRDYHITLGLPQDGEHEDDITDADIDQFFLDAQPVRLVKLRPRT